MDTDNVDQSVVLDDPGALHQLRTVDVLEELARVEESIDSLFKYKHKLIMKARISGCSNQKIANVLGVTEGAIRMRVNREAKAMRARGEL